MIPTFRALARQTIVRPITEDIMPCENGRTIIKNNLDAGVDIETDV